MLAINKQRFANRKFLIYTGVTLVGTVGVMTAVVNAHSLQERFSVIPTHKSTTQDTQKISPQTEEGQPASETSAVTAGGTTTSTKKSTTSSTTNGNITASTPIPSADPTPTPSPSVSPDPDPSPTPPPVDPPVEEPPIE